MCIEKYSEGQSVYRKNSDDPGVHRKIFRGTGCAMCIEKYSEGQGVHRKIF